MTLGWVGGLCHLEINYSEELCDCTRNEFSLYRVTSAWASIAISHRIIFCTLVVALSDEVPFSIAIGNEELMPECFPKHSRLGTAIMK